MGMHKTTKKAYGQDESKRGIKHNHVKTKQDIFLCESDSNVVMRLTLEGTF